MDYKTLGCDPISEAAPTGSDVRYGEEFELLQAEIDKLSSPLGRESFKWETVVKNASVVLKDQSKDLLAASYLGVALVHLEGASGLLCAVQVMGDLVNTYWEDLFPALKRQRGRIAAIEWWLEKTESALATGDPGVVADGLAEEIRKRLNEVSGQLDNLLGGKVSAGSLKRTVDTYLSKAVPEKAPEKELPDVPAGEAPQPASKVAAPAGGLPGEGGVQVGVLEHAEQVPRQLRQVFQTIAQGAKVLREATVSDVQSYQWLRFAVYAGVKVAPATIGADGKTSIAAPPPQLMSSLDGMHRNGRWDELLNASENALMNAQYAFWLDLHHYTALALRNMNGCADAAEAVEQDVSALLKRLQGIETLCFSNLKPFAGEDAREWIQELTAASAYGVDGSGGSPAAAVLDESLEEAVQEARAIAEDPKRVGGALRVLEQQINRCASEKDVLELRLVMLELLSKTKQAEPAAALAELVLKDVERFRLREWDVPLAVRCHLQVYDIFKKASDRNYKEKQREVYQRVLAMSAADALNL